MKTLSIETLRVHEACDLDRRVSDLIEALGGNVSEDEEVPLEAWFNLDSTSLGDALWVACIVLGRTDVAVEVARLAAVRNRLVRFLPIRPAVQTVSRTASRTAFVTDYARIFASTPGEHTAQWNDLYRLLDLETL